MIARIWHGVTPVDKADEYLRFTRAKAIPDYQSVPGNQGAFVLRRLEGDKAHFLTLSFWDSLESIKGFAGNNLEEAKYYAEDSDFLEEFEPTVQHYELYDTAG
ncbi:MAG: hypothetical protein WBR18_11075 [Anaerolineales bacterium]